MSSTLTAESTFGLPPTGEIWRRPLPHETSPINRMLYRAAMAIGRRWVLEVRGLEHIAPENDPFLFVANHNQRPETALLLSTLVYHRGGKVIHFLADWPIQLIPFIGFCYRRAQVITVGHKDARIPIFNLLKPLLTEPGSAIARAAEKIRGGASVGLFPEATMNRDPKRLLRGRTGTALLALTTGVPIVPAGIRFPLNNGERPISDGDRITIDIEPPFALSSGPREQPDDAEVDDAHRRIMEELSRLSGKSWSPDAPLRRY